MFPALGFPSEADGDPGREKTPQLAQLLLQAPRLERGTHGLTLHRGQGSPRGKIWRPKPVHSGLDLKLVLGTLLCKVSTQLLVSEIWKEEGYLEERRGGEGSGAPGSHNLLPGPADSAF